MPLYPWYEVLENSKQIQQGDFIADCPIIVPPSNFSLPEEGVDQINLEEELEAKTLNVVVVSQSCDLENGKIEIVLVCPYYTIDYFFKNLPANDQTGKGRARKIEALKQGNLPGYHL